MNPVFKQWRKRPKSAKPTSFQHPLHQSLCLYPLSVILHHRPNIHHLNNVPLADLAPTVIALHLEDMTNVQSPSTAVPVVDVQLDAKGAHRDLDLPPEMCPLADRSPDDQIEYVQSLFDQHLHNIEKPEIRPNSTVNYTNTLPQCQPSKLHLGGKIDKTPPTLSLPASSHQSKWIDYTQPSPHHGTPHDSATKPLTAFSSTHTAPPRHKQKKPAPSGDDRSTASVNVPSGHMLINLQEGSKEEWIRGVKFGLHRPERMPAASEVPTDMKPRPTKTVEITEFNRAVATLQKVDSRIPAEITRKAVHLLSSTNLLPVFDLEKPYIIHLPSTNMLALILPLPDSSRFQMPPPLKTHQNHTWALLGTTIGTSHAILLEGKIGPANWSYNKNYSRSDLPTFGAFYIGREVSNSDIFPDWAAKELMDLWIPSKRKGKDNKTSSLGRCTEVHANILPSKLGAMKRQNLPQTIDADDSSTDDCNYRSINARTKDHHSGRWDDYRP